jgi:hypothetical protein
VVSPIYIIFDGTLKLFHPISRRNILKANLQYKMPVLFGGGCNSARPIVQKAKAAIEQQKSEFTVMPHWGGPILADLIKACPL